MKQLYIDFDGVILDTMTKTYKEIEEAGIDKTNQEKVMEYFRSIDWEKLIEETDEINDSINEIGKLTTYLETKGYNVEINLRNDY